MRQKQKRIRGSVFMAGVLLTALVFFLGNRAIVKTSSDEYCASCHIHPHSTQSWKRSTHYDNKRGIRVRCVDCHLPPHGEGYLVEKTRTGLRDVWAKWFKDPEDINWEAKSRIEYAKNHVFETSCIDCHKNNFPLGLNKEGRLAHLYYEQQEGTLHCINCHITVGHHDPDRLHAKNTGFGMTEKAEEEIFTEPATVEGFADFTEFIPGSGVSFEMVALPGGSFMMGSPEDEPFRRSSEGPVKEVSVDSFFMAKTEVSWDEYLVFFSKTGAQGKSADAYLNEKTGDVDAISGPTPPWGAPDQGWGKGRMPAITMTHHAAEVYCQWLTKITGKRYRLPSESEWEYAARGGTSTPYFFEGDPKRYVKQGLRNKLFGIDTSGINTFIVYRENSESRSAVPESGRENPFGLVHILGNVAEFCSDWYAEDAGVEHVIRGGSYRDDAGDVRCASRTHTKREAWLKTDPQIPKSIWWYSDCIHVGFRVVCEYNESVSDE
ncbi:MAG: SUMF1/EgtB/PvdO family nonheme iron enzyme [Bacteroidota bacterium]